MVKPIISRNEILDLMKTGLNQNDIAKKFGVSRQAISEKLRLSRKGCGRVQQKIRDMKVGEIIDVSGPSAPYHIAAKSLGIIVAYRKGKLVRMG